MYHHPSPISSDTIVERLEKNENVVSLLFSQIDSTACHELGIHITKEELHEMLDKGYSSFKQKLTKRDLRVLGEGVYGTVYSYNNPISLGLGTYSPREYVIKKYETVKVKSKSVNPTLSLKSILNNKNRFDVETIKKLNNLENINKPVGKNKLLFPSKKITAPCLLGTKKAKALNGEKIIGVLTNKPLKFSKNDYICDNDFPVEAMIGSYITQVIQSPFFVPVLSFTVCFSGTDSTLSRFMFLERADGTIDNIVLKEQELLDVIFMVFVAFAKLQEHGFNHLDTKIDNVFYKNLPQETKFSDIQLREIPNVNWFIETKRLAMIGDYGVTCRYFPFRIGIDAAFENNYAKNYKQTVPNEFSSSYDVLFFLNNLHEDYPRSTIVKTLLYQALSCYDANEIKHILNYEFINNRPKHRVTKATEHSASPTTLLRLPIFNQYRN